MKKYKRQSVEYKDCLFKHEDKDLGETQRCYKMILVISGKSFNYRRNTYEESIHENTTLKIYMVRYTCIMISEVFFVNTILNVSFKKKTEKKLKGANQTKFKQKKTGIFMLVIGIPCS